MVHKSVLIIKHGFSETCDHNVSPIVSYGDVFRCTCLLEAFRDCQVTWISSPVVRDLLEENFSVGIWAVMHPEQVDIVLAAQERARGEGIDFRTKDFLGYHQGKLYGQYKYANACSGRTNEQVLCRTTEFLIGPDGSIYRCHHDLYEKLQPIGHILDADYQIDERFLPCDSYGCCNPCDVKIKTNRLQQFGHTSVAIKFRESEQHLFAFGKQVCL